MFLKSFPANGTPVLLVNYVQFLTFLLLLLGCLYMIRLFRKKNMESGSPVSLFLNSTIVFIFHLVICGYGFQYAGLFETVPSENIFARIGMLTCFFITPILYLIVAALFARLCFFLSQEKDPMEE